MCVHVCLFVFRKKEEEEKERKDNKNSCRHQLKTTERFFQRNSGENLCRKKTFEIIQEKDKKKERQNSFLRVNVSSMLTHTHTIKSSEKKNPKEEHKQRGGYSSKRTQIPNLKVFQWSRDSHLLLIHLREFGLVMDDYWKEKERRRRRKNEEKKDHRRKIFSPIWKNTIKTKERKKKTKQKMFECILDQKKTKSSSFFCCSRLSLINLFSWQVVRITMSWWY